MTELHPGMDHGLYRFSAIRDRAPLVWPNGARLSVTVLLHLEYWELQPPEGSHRDTRFTGEYGFYFPEYRPFTQREYGNRLGLWRVLDALERTPLKVSVAANSLALSRYPEAVEALLARGVEFVAHGEAQSRMVTSQMSEGQERDLVGRVTDAFRSRFGRMPAGWLGPDSGESTRTPQLLAEAGYEYLLDWPNDDQPYAMTTEPPLVSIPNQMEWDDVTALWLRKVPNARYPGLVGQAAETLASEGGRSFILSLHPWVIGQPHRIRYLREAIGRLLEIDGLWHATAGDVAARSRAQIL